MNLETSADIVLEEKIGKSIIKIEMLRELKLGIKSMQIYNKIYTNALKQNLEAMYDNKNDKGDKK